MTTLRISQARRAQSFLGTWISVGSPVISELAACAGFDWLLFDLEHGSFPEAALLGNLQAIRGTDALGIVRVGTPHPDLIVRALDWGAAGIMLPHAESAKAVEACLPAMHYPPRGRRGVSRSIRAYDYGLRSMPVPEDLPAPLLFAQIETLRGVEHAEAIAAIDGVDVLFVGPGDLSYDLSLRNGGPAPDFDECLNRVVQAARNAGKHAGILAHKLDDLPRLQAMGFTHYALESDLGILRVGYRRTVLEARRSDNPTQKAPPPSKSETAGRRE
jgi:2-keto-3-deoxy-L-rhamnonate aldolase RhmA